MATSRDLQVLDEIWDRLVSQLGYRKTASLSSMASETTSANMTLYVNAATGSDANDGLTPNTALATALAAEGKIPRFIDHTVKVNFAAGTYVGPQSWGCFCISFPGSLNIVGTVGPAVLATGTSTGTIGVVTAGVPGGVPQSFQDLTQSWTVNDLQGRLISINGSTTYRVIAANTSNTITLVNTGVVTAGQSYSIVDPTTEFTSTTSVTVCATAVVHRASTGFRFSLLKLTNSSDNGGCFQASGKVILTQSVAISSGLNSVTVGLNDGFLQASSMAILNTGGGVGFGVSAAGNCGDTLNINAAYIRTGASGAVVRVDGMRNLFATGAWLERTVTSGNPILSINQVGGSSSQGAGITMLAPVGNTGVGMLIGAESTTGGGGYSAMCIGVLTATNFSAAVSVSFGSRCLIGTSGITNCTTAFAASLGGEIRVTTAPTFSGVTNEFTLDGTAFTSAAVLAATPLPIISNAQTFASIGRY